MHDMRGRVADGAVRMRETIRMEMRLLDSRAEDEKDAHRKASTKALPARSRLTRRMITEYYTPPICDSW